MGRDFFDKKQNIIEAELKPLPPETKLSDTELTPKDPENYCIKLDPVVAISANWGHLSVTPNEVE